MRSRRRLPRRDTRPAPWAWTPPIWASWTVAWPFWRRPPTLPAVVAGSTTSCAPMPTGRPCSTSTRGGKRRWPWSTRVFAMPATPASVIRTARSCAATRRTSCSCSVGGRNRRWSAVPAWPAGRPAWPGSAPSCTSVWCWSSRAPTRRRLAWWAGHCCSWNRCRPVNGRPWCCAPRSACCCGAVRPTKR